MKKLMVLALVLGVAALANAGLVLKVDGADVAGPVKVNPGAEVKVSIFGDAKAYNAFTEITGGISYGAFAFTGNAGDMSKSEALAGYPGWYLLTVAGGPSAPTTAGEQVLVTLKVDQDGVFNLYDGDEQFLSGIAFTVIPEPMTMGLLALGGLFIRRKK